MNTRLEKNPVGFYELAEKPTAQELKKYYEDIKPSKKRPA